MKVLNARVRWMWKYANPPSIEMLVDIHGSCWEQSHSHYEEAKKLNPYNNPLVIWNTKKLGIRTFAWVESGGLYYYFFHNPHNESGYGGSVHSIYTLEGLQHFKGPWSSNEDNAARYFNKPLFGVGVTCDPASFERGYTFNHATIDIATMHEACRLAGVELRKIEVPDYGGESELSREQNSVVTHGGTPIGIKYEYVIAAPGKAVKDNHRLHPSEYMSDADYEREKDAIRKDEEYTEMIRKKYAGRY